jgi:predicted secreted hydrolase
MNADPTRSPSTITRRTALAGLGAAGVGLALAAVRPAAAQDATPAPSAATPATTPNERGMVSDLVPVGDMPSVTYQGEVASLDTNPIPIFVSSSQDLVAKPGSSSDSWYLISHLETSRGTLDVQLHLIHRVPPVGGPGALAVSASVLDSSTGRYVSEEQDFPGDQCSFSTETCEVISPIATIRGDAQALNFRGTWSTAGIACDITVAQAGPMLANAGTGLFPFLGGITYEYALPTMTTTGTVTIAGETVEVNGNSWLDRQWSDASRFAAQASMRWVWLGVSLDNGIRISLWDLIEADRRHRFATILHPNGAHEVVTVEPTVEKATRLWKSPETGHVYPTRWDVRMPQIDSQLSIKPDVITQEFKSPDGVLHRYEAAAPVTGTLHGEPVNGYTTIELVGAWV